jgi:adenylyl- and sulfurtransferase ThiI
MELTIVEGTMDSHIIEQFMKENHAQAVVSGIRYHQFNKAFMVNKEPVFYPLIGVSEQQITSIADQIEDFNRFISGFSTVDSNVEPTGHSSRGGECE